jgi:hypothetical protein
MPCVTYADNSVITNQVTHLQLMLQHSYLETVLSNMDISFLFLKVFKNCRDFRKFRFFPFFFFTKKERAVDTKKQFFKMFANF